MTYSEKQPHANNYSFRAMGNYNTLKVRLKNEPITLNGVNFPYKLLDYSLFFQACPSYFDVRRSFLE